MAIYQIQMRHDELQDRILLRVSTTEAQEFRFWLTRRFVKRFWGLLLKMLEQDRPVRQQVDPVAKQSVMNIQHEGFAQQANYSKPYEDRQYVTPLGNEPVLVAKAEGRLKPDGNYLIRMHPHEGQGIDMTMDARLLHVFSKLLSDTAVRADWDMKLSVSAEAVAPEPEAAPSRKLN